MPRILKATALCAVMTVALGCAMMEDQPPAQPPAVKEFRSGLRTMDTYLAWYESVGRRMAEDPASVTQDERTKFLAIGQALRKMSAGLNVAVGNIPEPAAPAPR